MSNVTFLLCYSCLQKKYLYTSTVYVSRKTNSQIFSENLNLKWILLSAVMGLSIWIKRGSCTIRMKQRKLLFTAKLFDGTSSCFSAVLQKWNYLFRTGRVRSPNIFEAWPKTAKGFLTITALLLIANTWFDVRNIYFMRFINPGTSAIRNVLIVFWLALQRTGDPFNAWKEHLNFNRFCSREQSNQNYFKIQKKS